MKRLFTILFCLCTTYLQAQDPGARPGQPIGGIVVKGGQNPRPKDKFQISAGAGFISPSQAVKNNLNIGNLINYSLDLYIPVLNYGGATGGVISYGFNVAGSYLNGNKDYNLSNNPSYNIIGQSTSSTITAKGTGSPKQQGFKTEAGVQANFNFGNFSISPILNAAYINFKQKAFSVTQTSSVNGQTREFNLYSQVENKTSGLAFIPKIQFRYNFGDPGNFGVFIEPNYIIGPTVKNDATTFQPNGVANAQGLYNIDQILFGNNLTAPKSTKLNGFGLNAGISFALGKGQKKTIGKQKNPPVNNIKEFSNGCTRTCTGNWTWNQSSNTYSCSGEAGPLVCANGMGNTPLTNKIGQLFNPAGEVVEIAPGSVIGKNAKQLNEEKDNTNPNSGPQSIIYGGNQPPILLCYKLFNLANELVPIDGFVNMYNVYSISLTPCGGNDPNAFVSFPPLGTNVNNQTIDAKLLTKSDKSLAGKGIKFEKDIDISKDIAEKYQVENAIIKAGIYTFNNKNEINLPIVFGQPTPESKGNNFGEKMVGGIHAAGNNAKETNPKYKCNCGTTIYGKDEAACKRICQFLKDGTYSNLGFSPDELADFKESYLNNFFVLKDGIKVLNPEQFKLVTKPSDWEGKKVSISKNKQSFVYLGNQDELVRVISIPSNRPTACSDCNETDNCDNSSHFDCCCNNGYCWCSICIIRSTLTPLSDGEKLVDPNSGSNGTGQSNGNIIDKKVITPSLAQPIGSNTAKTADNLGQKIVATNINDTQTPANTQNKSNSEGCISIAYERNASQWADANHKVTLLTTQSSMQGQIPVYLNSATINTQLIGYPSGKTIAFCIYRIDYLNFHLYQFGINDNPDFVSTSSSNMTRNINVANLPPGKYCIRVFKMNSAPPEENLCMPIFIIAKKLINKTVLPSCVYPQQTIPITWAGGSGTANVNLVLRRMNTPTAYTPINISIPNTGAYNLTIPSAGFTLGESYAVEINDGNQYASTIYKNDVYTPGNVFKICKKAIDKNTLTKTSESKLPTGLQLQANDCNCGSWQSKIIKIDDQVKEIVCNNAINLKLNSNAFFNLKYNGSTASCNIKYEVILTKPNGSTSTLLITNNTNWNYVFNTTGNYSLLFKTYSNDILCPDSCKYTVIVN